MRYLAIGAILLSLGGVGVIVFAQLQNNAKRTPTLTTDDVPARGPGSTSSTTTSKTIEPASGSISWEKDIYRAKQMAASGDKLIIVDVYTDWCGWCKKMDQVIYSDPMIVGLSRQEVFLKLDAEDGGQGERFAQEMGVRGYPTTVILDSSGKKLTSAAGFIPTPEKFIQFVDGARSRKRTY